MIPMSKKIISIGLCLAVVLTACKKTNNPNPPPPPPTPTDTTMYYPPNGSSEWHAKSAASLGWNESLLPDLYNYLQTKNTKAFLILKDGRMVIEKYFGTFTVDSNWYWASAGKTMMAMLVGIAEEDNFLHINHRTSTYLGVGWTSLPPAKEDLITIKNQLTMTTGLDDDVQPNSDCTLPSCLQYKADAGTRWAYHNAPYSLLYDVIQNATNQNFATYFNTNLRDPIGMNGAWIPLSSKHVYFSTPRSMARFGLLMLNKGKWKSNYILHDSAYYNAQINTSQDLNKSYGYLTWLNGKESHMLPNTQFIFNGPIAISAPTEMYAAMGKNDQRIYIIPSKGIVVIRMGDDSGNGPLAVSSFDNELWDKLRPIMGL